MHDDLPALSASVRRTIGDALLCLVRSWETSQEPAPAAVASPDWVSISALDPSGIPSEDVAAFAASFPGVRMYSPFLVAAVIAELRSHVRALDAVIAEDRFPAAVLIGPLTAGADPGGPLPSDWRLAFLAGYPFPGRADSPPSRWLRLGDLKWCGLLSYAVRDRDVAIELRRAWAEELRPAERSMVPALGMFPTYGASPPVLVEPSLGNDFSPTPPVRPIKSFRWKGRTLEGVPIWWINLDRRPHRRQWMRWQLRGWPGPVTRVRAVDGVTLSDEELPRPSMRRVDRTARQFRGDFACTRSHRFAIETLIATDRYPAIVLEDDARLQPGWAHVLPPEGWQLALLGSIPGGDEAIPPVVNGWTRVVRARWKLAHAYAVADCRAAQALQEAYRREADGAADLVWRPVFDKVTTYAAVPQRCKQAFGDTDIHTP
jgi:hypothetical protein